MYKEYKDNRDCAEDKMDLTSLLKDLLMREKDEYDKFLDQEDVDEILKESPDSLARNPRESIFGYPTRPLYRELGNMLQIWAETRKCPVLDLPNYDLLDEKLYIENRAAVIHSITPKLEGLRALWTTWSQEERRFTLREVLKLLGKRGLLDLLGVRKTVGSYDLWPPPRCTIEKTFKEKHTPGSDSILTVGARALAKHSHRDQSSSWWGVCTGSEAAKNAHAEDNMKKILDNATWVNIHGLPHEITVIEARQENGYGVRWTSDGKQFRGFLEPQMVDGHAVGWKH